MTTQVKIYKKHHSFENFISSLNVDPEAQRVRVIHILREHLKKQELDDMHRGIFQSAADDLAAEDSEADFKLTTFIADELSKIDDSHIPRYIYHRYRYDIYPKRKILDDYPPYLQIEPSSVCNYRCVFCYQVDSEFTDKAQGHMGQMSFELFKEIVDDIEGNVDFISLASRGEPFICREIDKMLEYCVDKFLGLKINTNASLLNEKHCHAILAGGVNTVVFSADAAKEPLYSKLRVNGDLKKVLKNIRMFNQIKSEHYPNSRIITRVSGVKFDDQQKMDSMVELWGDLVDQVCFVMYNPSHGLDNIYEAAINEVRTPCSEFWRRMFIWHNGIANPCETDYKSTLSIGKVKQGNISKVWRSQEYNKLRETHLEEKRSSVHPCNRCVVT